MSSTVGAGAKALGRILLVVSATFILSSLIDPYLPFSKPLVVHAFNAILPVTFALLLMGLTGRGLASLALTAVALETLRYANLKKASILQTQIVYADLRFLGALLEDPQLILGFLKLNALTLAAGLGIVAAGVFLWWFARRERALPWLLRGTCLAAAAAILFIIGTMRLPSNILDWRPYQQTGGGARVGVSGNILMGRMTAQDIKRPVDSKAVDAFWKNPLVQETARALPKDGSSLRPDIVVIQSESLFEAGQLCGMSDTPVLKTMAAQKPHVPMLPGNLVVSVFGGQTVQSEFESLTGTPVTFYNGSAYAYFDVLDHPVNAFPRILGDLGYKTIAIHPFQRNFWNRGWALPMLGFQTFVDNGAFFPDDRLPGRRLVSDMALTRGILAELDSSDRPTFVTAVTINNHGPYGLYAPDDDSSLGLPQGLAEDTRRELADYVMRSHEADDAYGFLLEALRRRARPTIVVIYGDHMPPMPNTYRDLCFKDGKPPGQHRPVFRVWANFSVPDAPETTAAFLMQGWIARAAGLPLSGQLLANAITGELAYNPAIPGDARAAILSSYASVAAAHLEERAVARRDDPNTFVIQPDRTLATLQALSSQELATTTAPEQPVDLALQGPTGDRSETAFDIHGGVVRMTLRPYLASPGQACQGSSDPQVRLIVEGDGRPLYSAALRREALRLVTLDLRGIERLTFRTEAGVTVQGCNQATVRIAQMQCLTRDCKGGSMDTVPTPGATPRSLIADALEGDLAAMSSGDIAAAQPVEDGSVSH